MKLPEFSESSLLDQLRLRMGAPLIKDQSLTPKCFPRLTPDELKELSREGLDRFIDDCGVEEDSTLSYRGQRVVVYIRDRHMYGKTFSLPKYHVSYCSTLKDQVRKDRYTQKYVLSQRVDGLFPLNIFRDGNKESAHQTLEVCQNCLEVLRWDFFSYQAMAKEARAEIVREFSLEKFFERYPRDVLNVIPKYTSETAPINDYPSNWADISRRIRDERGHRCQRCGASYRLQVHHKNGVRSDSLGNRSENLEVLCHSCHSLEHAHMR